jgi:hypothetical protein
MYRAAATARMFGGANCTGIAEIGLEGMRRNPVS